MNLDELLWAPQDLRDGIQTLAVEAGLPIWDVVLPPVEPSPHWLEHACDLLGLEIETTLGLASELESALTTVAPGCMLMLGDMRVLCVVSSSRSRLTVLSIRMERVSISASKLASALEALYRRRVDPPAFLTGMPEAQALYGVAVSQQSEVQGPLFAAAPFRISTAQPFQRELAQTSFLPRLVTALVLLGLQSAVAIGATVVLGQSAMSGRADDGRILGWGLALASQAALQGALAMVVGRLNIELATILKRRLVDGALALEPDFVRQAGVGANLSTAAESATIDQLSVSDLSDAFSASFVFATAMAFLAGQDLVSAGVMAAIAILGVVLVARQYAVSTALTNLRIKLTDIFIERVLGHHTRLVQLPRSRWHEGEDEQLHAYAETASSLDTVQAAISVLPRAALVVLALLQLRTVFDAEQRYLSLLPLVAGYVAMQALAQLVRALQRLVRWPVSLRVLLPIIARSMRKQPGQKTKLPDSEVADGDVVLEASGLCFAYDPLRPPVLQGLDLKIRAGEQLLVTGPSGGGKSTLSAVLTALRQPTSGLVMLHGLDQHSVASPEWRRRVVSAPQFHENYIFQNTLAFNLLMGRAWPPTPPDLAEADEVCRELGLGTLIDSMPAGLQQSVGETGWRLSHGERSRVFIARALLQNADVMIFDESFGALDPEILELAVTAVRRRARTLLVVSHK